MNLISFISNPFVSLGLGALGTFLAGKAAIAVKAVKKDLASAKAKIFILEQKVADGIKADVAKAEAAVKAVESAVKADVAKVESAVKADVAKVESAVKADVAADQADAQKIL